MNLSLFNKYTLLLHNRSSDKRVKIWDFTQRVCIHTLENHSDQVWGVAYNEDGTKLVSVGDDRNMIIYEKKDSV